MLESLGIELVKHTLPFRLNHVNCFVAEGENGHLIIDSGLHDEETVTRWNEALGNKKITDIFITHHHPDHFGYAGGLQQKYDARLYMSKIDAESGFSAWSEPLLENLANNYKLCGIPQEIGDYMVNNTKSFIPLVTPYPEVNHYFEEHERFQIGKYEYEVIFTPGHSDGLVTFFNEEKKVLISTDHILPRITPNISYWFYGDPNPLQSYFDSLHKVRKLNADYVIPSHGKPFYDGNKRIDEIIAHHDERLNETIDQTNKHRTVYRICEALFDFELTVHETRFAIGETIAHLEYLRLKGEVQREEIDGVWHYEVT